MAYSEIALAILRNENRALSLFKDFTIAKWFGLGAAIISVVLALFVWYANAKG